MSTKSQRAREHQKRRPLLVREQKLRQWLREYERRSPLTKAVGRGGECG
jgi:hypothetical protein